MPKSADSLDASSLDGMSKVSIDTSSPTQESLSQRLLESEAQPLHYVEPPSSLETAADAAQRGLEALSESVPKAVAELDPVTMTERGFEALHETVEHAVTHPMTALHHAVTVAELAAAATSGGVAGMMRHVSSHSAKMAADALGAAVFDNELNGPPTAAEADANGYLRQGQYYSRDGGNTWLLLAKGQVALLSQLPFGGLFAILLAALAMLAAVVSKVCALPLPASPASETFRAPTLPAPLPPIPPFSERSSTIPPTTPGDTTPDVFAPAPPLTGSTPSDERYVDWEAALQAERVRAAQQSGTDEYNALLERHRRIYEEHHVNPCTSSRFPQGC
jgi:hypothetical protein